MDGFQLRIHGMPCVNECGHCHSFGKPGSVMMDLGDIRGILRQAADLRERVPLVALTYLYEPTVHPGFVEIFEEHSRLGLLWDGFFFPTNGSGLARLDDAGWERLKAAGMDRLELTFHGLGWEHDSFAGRRRAYRDLISTLEKAEAHGIGWMGLVVVRSSTVDNVHAIIDGIRAESRGDPSIDCMVFNWLGRGADDSLRPTEDDLPRTPLDPGRWKSERRCREEILSSSDLAGRQVSSFLFNHALLEVFSDRRVFAAGGCDSAPPAEFLPFLELGMLDERGLLPLAEKYSRDLPLPMKLLRGVTWGYLAERYGDSGNDHLYDAGSIARQKWATLFLRDALPGSPGG